MDQAESEEYVSVRQWLSGLIDAGAIFLMDGRVVGHRAGCECKACKAARSKREREEEE